MAEQDPSAARQSRRCRHCGTEWGDQLLTCVGCGRLVHAERLQSLAGEAESKAAAGDVSGALERWRSALELLPQGTRQYSVISERIASKVAAVEKAERPGFWKDKSFKGAAAGLGAVGLILWKLKAVLLVLLTKGKLLLLGLTKASTFFSMFLSLGAYWALWGWRFALSLVAMIYVHEIGHVAALKRLGIAASAPMFIPGFGALVRMKQYPASPIEDARVGLAGPIWGCGACLVSAAIFVLFDLPFFGAAARIGAWINLFNLLPVWTLDGARGFSAMTRFQRGLAAGSLLIGWLIAGDGMVLLLAIVAGARTFIGEIPERGDWRATLEYCSLALVLSLLFLLVVPTL